MTTLNGFFERFHNTWITDAAAHRYRTNSWSPALNIVFMHIYLTVTIHMNFAVSEQSVCYFSKAKWLTLWGHFYVATSTDRTCHCHRKKSCTPNHPLVLIALLNETQTCPKKKVFFRATYWPTHLMCITRYWKTVWNPRKSLSGITRSNLLLKPRCILHQQNMHIPKNRIDFKNYMGDDANS